MTIIRDSSEFEVFVRPLLEAANTECWRNALNILYMSPQILSFSPSPLNFPCLISAKGPYDETIKSEDLLSGKAKVTITPILTSLVKLFLPDIRDWIKEKEKDGTLDEMNEDERIPFLVGGFLPKIEMKKDDISRTFVQGAFAFSDIITIGIFDTLLRIREKQQHCSFDDEDYEEIIDNLFKLGLIEPKLQVNICPDCANYQLSISRNPYNMKKCPKCGTEWATLNFYTFQKPYCDIKLNNTDLPLFISSYLNFKIESEIPPRNVVIVPNAVVKNKEDFEAEIDVYIPEFAIGIECKVYEDAYSPMTDSRLGSLINSIVTQIKRYTQVGIRRFILINNLSANSGIDLERKLKESLEKENIDIQLDILYADIDSLLFFLDKLAKNCVESVKDSQLIDQNQNLLS